MKENERREENLRDRERKREREIHPKTLSAISSKVILNLMDLKFTLIHILKTTVLCINLSTHPIFVA